MVLTTFVLYLWFESANIFASNLDSKRFCHITVINEKDTESQFSFQTFNNVIAFLSLCRSD